MNRVIIAIQARSSSKRFPNKISERIGKRTCLQAVLETCQNAAFYLNNWASKKLFVDVALLVPYGDPILAQSFPQVEIIEGPEDDVLSRYAVLVDRKKPDYICRITADCPLIPHFLISKLITIAVMNNYDYVSNVDERCRTALDGYDCEVISAKALIYSHMNASDPSDREHVTTYLRKRPPAWLTQGTVINFLDLAPIKLSLDTLADLQRIKSEYFSVEAKLDRAIRIFGKRNVHRF